MYCGKDDEMKQLMDDQRLKKYYNRIANEPEEAENLEPDAVVQKLQKRENSNSFSENKEGRTDSQKKESMPGNPKCY